MRLSETGAKNAHKVEEACRSKSFDEIEDEAKMLTRQTANTTNAQDLSHKLKVNEFADLTNYTAVDRGGAVPRSNDNANGIVRGRVRKSDNTTPQMCLRQT